jgi:hypothetical protein
MFIVNHNVENPIEYILYPNHSYWFIYALFFITSIFSVIQYLSNKVNINQDIAIILTSLCLVGISRLLPDPKYLGVEYISYYFMYYTMGYLIHKFNKYMPSNTVVLITLAIIWFMLGSFWESKEIPAIIPECLHSIPMLNVLYRMLTATIFIIAMFGLAFKYDKNENSSTNGILKNLLLECGQISLGLYTAHKIIIIWLIKGIMLVMPNVPTYVHITITFVLLTALSVIMVRLISKWHFSAYWLLGKK